MSKHSTCVIFNELAENLAMTFVALEYLHISLQRVSLGALISLQTMADAEKGKHACKGQNECKGQGGCKTSDGGCKAKNSCKGKGGCATDGTKPPQL